MKKIRIKRMGLVSVMLILLAAGFSSAYGDIYWEDEMVTGGMPQGLENLPEHLRAKALEQFKPQTEIVKHYLTSQAFRSDTQQGIFIVKYDDMKIFSLDPSSKTYTVFDLKGEKEMDMMKGIMSDIKMTPTNETKVISGYKCQKTIVNIMGQESEYWLSKDVEGYDEFKALNEKLKEMAEKSPMLKQLSMPGLDGFPVQTIINMMGMKTSTTLKKIEKKTLSAELFTVPKDYQLKQE